MTSLCRAKVVTAARQNTFKAKTQFTGPAATLATSASGKAARIAIIELAQRTVRPMLTDTINVVE
jgi:hypothetical protein